MQHVSRLVITIVFVCAATASLSARSPVTDVPDEFDELRAQAEEFYAEGSYRRALEIYERAAALDLDEEEARWVQFRIADTTWREQASTSRSDNTIADRARADLEKLLQGYEVAADRDPVWALVQESLGDYWWDRNTSQNWHRGWQHYHQALEYWAGSRDLERARREYLDLVFRATEPSWIGRNQYYRQYIQVPADVLENAVKIAEAPDDLTRAEYLLAMVMRNQGGWRQQQRVEELFTSVIDRGAETAWYDDALFFYAEWLSQRGVPVRLEGGQWTNKLDFKKALALYQALVREFNKGETPWFDQATNRIQEITAPQLTVGVSNAFLPGSENQFNLYTRNIGTVGIRIHRVDLPRDVAFAQNVDDVNWLNHVDLSRATIARSMERPTGDDGNHMPRSETITLEEKLEPGAYVIVATGGGETARDILIVSQLTLITKSVADEVLVYACDALDGSPVAKADVVVWELRQVHRNNRWRWVPSLHRMTTGVDGTALATLKHSDGNGTLFVFANQGDQQAFTIANAPAHQSPGRQYRVYATTDRPAYRPGHTVSWKATARLYNDSQYTTPANAAIEYQINDPRGTKLQDGDLTLNEFGSAWGTVEIPADAGLGEYNVQFWTAGRKDYIGNATLFRIEEYKLPEFKVSVSTGETEQGKPRIFQLGDTVDVSFQAEYYFGGPVANADVEVVVYQRPFWYWWDPGRDYPWLYEDNNPYQWRGYYGSGQQMLREQIKTDDRGIATLSFETPLNSNQDFEYTIEARVTDSSRREVSHSDTIRVTRQRYYVNAKTEHRIYRPRENVKVEITARDANSNAVEAEGFVTVFRDEWKEVWIAPDGREVTGDELREIRSRMRFFPPDTKPGQPAWRLKYRGYESELVLEQTVRTDAEGQGTLAFTPSREGYFRIQWVSEKADLYPVTAQTMVWVCDDATRSIGYFHGGVDLIVDKDSFTVGQRAPVMVSVPVANQHVLFTVEGNDLHSYQVVHIEGNVKLLHMEVKDRHIPNVWLQASIVSAAQLLTDVEQVIVPPTDHFLNVDVALDHDAYLPGDSGSLMVTTTDQQGQPVRAEVSIAVIDESVYYIQKEIAGDPREFFFSDRQWQQVQTTSSLYHKQFARLIKNEEGDVLNEPVQREAQLGDADERFDDKSGEYGRRELAADAPAEAMNRAAPMASRARGGGAGFGGGGGPGAPMDAMQSQGNESQERLGGDAGPGGEDSPNVRVRSDFRETALWLPAVITDDSGTATVEVNFPDSTTTWRATARAFTADTSVGQGQDDARTRQPLIVRLQAPRFFVVNDYVTLTAIVNNNTDDAFRARYEIDIEGLELLEQLVDGRPVALDQSPPIDVPANGSATLNWRVAARSAGEAAITVKAWSGDFADGMEKTYTVYEHGIEKHITHAGKVRGDDVTVRINLPARKEGATNVTVQVTPSMAATMLDALPYLIDYPYGCTEQTMSRFLPAAIVARTLEDLGIDPAVAMTGVFGGIEEQFSEQTQPRGKRDLSELDRIVEQGLNRLYDFQHSDGGWGWWKPGDSDHYMSAYVVWGLALAKQAGVDIDDGVLTRGMDFLRKEIVEAQNAHDIAAWMLHALAAANASIGRNEISDRFERAAYDNLWENRTRLNAYTRALFALAAHYYNRSENAQVLVRNLENGVMIDESPDTSIVMRAEQNSHPAVIPTAHWGEDGVYYRWSQGGVEATAFVVRALLAIDPDHKLIEPATNWLIKNRRGAQWSNTRDTAIVLLALTDWLEVSGELAANQEFEIQVNGQTIAHRTITPEDIFSGPRTFVVNEELLTDGLNDVRISRTSGDGPIYFMVDAEFFTHEEPITPAGHEVFVRRDYYKLVAYPTLLKGYQFDRIPMKDGDSIRSGERVEVVVTVEAKNNYEYMVFEDLKPAGLEAVQVQSGAPLYAKQLNLAGLERRFEAEPDVPAEDIVRDSSDYTGQSVWTYQELRDRHVAVFMSRLPEGTWEFSYEMRAEAPGEFHALPLMAHAMYVPEIRANSAEVRMTVYDRE